MAADFIYDWEKSLYQLAMPDSTIQESELNAGSGSAQLLEEAYQLTSQITREHSKTFFFASTLLPEEKRKAIRALYAFCRVSDDLVDRNRSDPRKALHRWHHPLVGKSPDENNLIALAWADTRERYEIPWHYCEQLIHGVSQDLSKFRYKDFNELAHYSYGVASTVGLMSMHIIGFNNHAAYTYAIRLGVALQVTNILRDIGEDYRVGRIYLPLNELTKFGLSEADIAKGDVSARWRTFMQFQINRNRRLYAEAKPGIGYLSRDGRFAVTAAADLYAGILNEIEKNDYDVFTQRASTSALTKIKKLPSIYKQSIS